MNPCGVRRQLVGVYARELVMPLAHALAQLGAEAALVVHGSDGLDEITTTGPTFAAHFHGGAVETRVLDAAELGIARARSEQLAGRRRGGERAHRARRARRAGPARSATWCW